MRFAILLVMLVLLVGCDEPQQPVVFDPSPSMPVAEPVVPTNTQPVNVPIDGAITARVVRILDGDTIAIMHECEEQIIRLTGIDCPETRGSGGQPFGKAVKQFTSELCFGREVQIVQTGRHFDRWLAFVYLDNGEFLQHELLRAGLAWHATKWSNVPTEIRVGQKDRCRLSKRLNGSNLSFDARAEADPIIQSHRPGTL